MRWYLAQIATAAVVVASGSALGADKVQIGNGQKEFPESLTSTSDGTLYFGSLTNGTITMAAPGATTTTVFIPKQADGPQGILGVLADEPRGTLWACYSDLAWFAGQQGLPTILRGFDLKTGAVKGEYKATGPSLCNDITVTNDGVPFIADTVMGAVLQGTDDGGFGVFKQDPMLAGADGLAFSPDGDLYVNSVTANKLFRVDLDPNGSAGAVTEIKTSAPLMGPDGMRFGPDGTLYIAENAAGHASAYTIDGDNATGTVLAGTYDGPTAVTQVGDTLWVLEAKIGKFGGTEDPGMFYAYPVALK